jgi:carbon-monoxide dehydrogenase medium subunit
MRPFNYFKPDNIETAVRLATSDADAKFLAGGMSLLPALKLRLGSASGLVDLTGLSDLRGVSTPDRETVRIGACSTHFQVNQSPPVGERIPALATLAGGIGDVQVRYRGTVGGSLANNDPAADYPAAALALNARIVTNRRVIAADDFFRGLFETALDGGELITAVEFRVPRRAAYLKFPNLASRFAIIGVFLADFGDQIRISVTGAGGGVFRLPKHEAALTKSFEPNAAAGISLDDTSYEDDLHASAAYRAHLTGVLVRNAVEACLENRT